MAEILDNNPSNMVIEQSDGTVEMIPKSPRNVLLYEYDLWGVFRSGDEILRLSSDEGGAVRVIPNEDATEFTIDVDDRDSLVIGQHKKDELLAAVSEVYDDSSRDPSPLIELFESLRSDQVRQSLVSWLSDQQPFAGSVKTQSDGWLINDHLKLTWEREFYHPNTTSYNRSGGVTASGASEPAYEIQVGNPSEDMTREIVADGTTYYLTDAELEFIAKGLWAIANAPGGGV